MAADLTATGLRKTGISIVGDLPWGSHFCYFYETKQDLLDTLALFFKAGLEHNEFCVWVVSQPLTVAEAKRSLGQAVSNLDRQLAKGSLEILGHDEWYLHSGQCDPQRVLQGWREKVNQALARGYAGMRASGDTAWSQKDQWMVFREYEKELDALNADQRRILLCTYPLTTIPGDQVVDVARIHHVAVARQHGSWEMIKTPELKQAKAEIQRLNDELEQKVEERTRELGTTVEALKQAEDRIRLVIDTIPTMAWSLRADGAVDFVNQRWMDYTGLSFADAIEEPMRTMHPDEVPRIMEKWLASKAAGESFEDEMRLRRADGEYRWFLVRTAPLLDQRGTIVKWYGTSTDIEDRKQAEQMLRDSGEQLRALTARLESLREEERMRISREIHDELGQKLTGLKMDLLRAERKIEELKTSPAVNSLLDTLVNATELADEITASVQEIAADLRPGALDKLGLGAAVQYEARRFEEGTGVPCRVRLRETEPALLPELSTALFRIFQECLTNVARHAGATKVEVGLKIEDDRVILSVRDNGRGITEAEIASPRSLGLLGMKERTALLGGELTIQRAPKGGTIVTAQLPTN